MRIPDFLKKPLRRLYWWYFPRLEARVERRRRRRLWKQLVFPLGKKVYLIGPRWHENLGDSAIVLAQKRFLEKCGWDEAHIKELTARDYERDWERIQKWIPRGSVIAQLGGGHLGNQWIYEENLHRQQVSAFPKYKNVIFPQTICYLPNECGREEERSSAAVYDGRKNLTMVARERISYETMRSLYPNTKVLMTPDIVLSATMEDFGVRQQERSGVLLCLRNDPERVLDQQAHDELEALLCSEHLSYGYVDMYSAQPVTRENRLEQVRDKMEQLSKARLVITDRLHGMVFCALTGTPCIAMSNNNHKVRGTYDWISYLPYIRFVGSVGDVEEYLPELLAMEHCSFDNTPLQPCFEQLAKVVRRDACN